MLLQKQLPGIKNVLKRFSFLFTLISATVFICCNALSQNVHRAAFPVFESLGPSKGLSCNFVTSIAQDKQGFMWFATDAGLYRYDGYHFERFKNSGNPNSFSDDACYRIFCSTDGYIWIGGKQLSRYDVQTGFFKKYMVIDSAYSKLNLLINGIAEDKKGNLVIAVDKLGLLQFNKKDEKASTILKVNFNKLYDEDIVWLSIDSNNCLYFADTMGRLIRLNLTNGLQVTLSDTIQKQTGVEPEGVLSTFITKENILWISCKHGMIAYNLNNNAAKLYPYKTTIQVVADAEYGMTGYFEDDEGKIWCATNDGLSWLEPATGRYYNYSGMEGESDTPVNLDVSSAYKDSSGKKWFGYWANTVNTFDPLQKKFTVYRHEANNPESISSSYIGPVIKDKENSIWIGNGKGLNIFNAEKKTFSVYHHPSDKKKLLSCGLSVQIIESTSNTFYVGYSFGYIVFNSKSNLFRYVNEGYNVNSFYIDKKNNTWLTLWDGGIKMIDTSGHEKIYKHIPGNPDSNADNSSNVLSEDDSGKIIFGTYLNGVEFFNPETKNFIVFRHDKNNPHSISHNTVSGYRKSKKGVMWFATLGGGLNAFDPVTQKFYSFTEDDGLGSNYIWSIAEDAKGNLWLGTINGISKFTPPQNIFCCDDDSLITKGVFRNYTMQDGLPSNLFNYLSAFFDSDNNTMYMGSTAGLVVFNPDSIMDNPFLPPVHITVIQTHGIEKQDIFVPAKQSKEIEIAYNQNSITFSFTALNFIHPEKNKYAYKLEGFDKDWIYTDASNRIANYTNLNPAHYIFKVKGSNNDGIWNPVEATLKFYIPPPWWQTWWFRVGVAVAVASIVYSVYRYRLNQVLKLVAIRNKIAEDLHDDVGSTLNSISVFSEVAKQEAGKQIPALDDIGASARRVVEAMSDIVWTINPENDHFDKVIIRMRSFAYQLLNGKKIEFVFRANESLNEIKLPMQVRKNFYLIFKEAVNNLAKYSYAKRASIQINHTSKQIKMIIRDDGIGYDIKNAANGNGLKNMRTRANEIHAELKIESVMNEGTTVELALVI